MERYLHNLNAMVKEYMGDTVNYACSFIPSDVITNKPYYEVVMPPDEECPLKQILVRAKVKGIYPRYHFIIIETKPRVFIGYLADH